MSDEKDDGKPPAERAEAVRLGWVARITFMVLGAGSTAAGVFAVIHKGMEGAAVVAFIVVALVLWLLGIVGHIPARVWGKDMGIEMGRLREQQRKRNLTALTYIDPEKRDEAAAAIDATTPGVTTGITTVAGVLHEAEQFEKECREYIYGAHNALPTAGLEVHNEIEHGYRVGDARLMSSHGLVVVKFELYVSLAIARTIVREFALWRNRRSRPSHLVVLTRDMDDDVSHEIERGGPLAWEVIEIVQLPYRVGGQEMVTEALQRALDSLKEEAGSKAD